MVDRSLRLLFCVGLAVCGSTRAARADSDGSYCTGPNYIAYELSWSLRDTTHFLYVLSLSDSGGIGARTTIRLPQFQVHGMRCEAGSVALLGWDSLYTVTVGGAHPTIVATAAPWAGQGPTRQPLAAYGASNLGALSEAVRSWRSDTVRLPIRATRNQFVLAIDVTPHPTRCVFAVVTRLVQVDRARAVRSVVLFDGEAPRECGE